MDESPAGPTGTPDTTSEGSVVTRHTGLTALLVATAALVITVDQVSKYVAVRDLTENVPITVISGWLQLHLIRNSGAAFSLATGMTWVLTVIATVVTVVIVRISRQLGSRWWALALGLLLGGALGNLGDRLLRAPGFGRGHVVDFIEYLRFPFMEFPIFNLADSCIVVAAGLIAALGLRGIAIDGTKVSG
jgi:signal peptidase II